MKIETLHDYMMAINTIYLEPRVHKNRCVVCGARHAILQAWKHQHVSILYFLHAVQTFNLGRGPFISLHFTGEGLFERGKTKPVYGAISIQPQPYSPEKPGVAVGAVMRVGVRLSVIVVFKPRCTTGGCQRQGAVRMAQPRRRSRAQT